MDFFSLALNEVLKFSKHLTYLSLAVKHMCPAVFYHTASRLLQSAVVKTASSVSLTLVAMSSSNIFDAN